MKVGILKELKNNEFRVSMTPAGVMEMKKNGHTVYVQKEAGVGSGFSDEAFKNVGAEILSSNKEVFDKSEMIMKVKEPIEEEYNLIRENQLLFTYFHFASSENLTKAMLKQKSVCLAYETVEKDKKLPLLTPMSEVAGRMSIQEGAKYLEKPLGGKGILLGGIPGVPPAKVLVLGGGVVGTEAAKMASGLGADVTIMDIDLDRLRTLSDIMPKNVKTQISNEYNIRNLVKEADLIIGAVLVLGAKAPKLIKKDMLATMKPGTVLVDVAIDQGGCIETAEPTTHENPTFMIDNVLHYCVANMPGAVPQTSTIGLTNATMNYAIELANKGWKQACKDNPSLKAGLNTIYDKIVYKPVADTFSMKYESDVDQFLN